VGKVFAAGSLNVAKALMFQKDIIQFKSDRHIEAGEIAPFQISVFEQVNDVKLRRGVYKIIPNYSDPNDPAKQTRILMLANGKLVHYYTNKLKSISFKTNQETKVIKLSDLMDIVPRQRFGNGR